MNGVPIELTTEECLDRLSAGTVGRVAFSTPGGLRMVPVNYAMFEGAIILRTSSYSELGTYAAGTQVAFEIDEFDMEHRGGWSVVANGRLERVNDPEEIQRVRLAWDPDPWAAGARNLYLRLTWRELTGRRLGNSWLRTARAGAV